VRIAVESVGDTKFRATLMEVDVTDRTPATTGRASRPHTRLARVTALVAIALMIAAAGALTACSSSTPASQPAATTGSDTTSAATAPAAPADKVKITDLKVGTGTEAKTGDNVTVDYTGWLMNGTKFDSSLDRHTPFSFPLGAGQVIVGWDQGVVGMKVGGKRELIIPPSLGYGAAGAGGGTIPPNATLKFDVTLLKVNGKK
jgi:FKBP-type peptidyl-prolyl cis-trans isomerase FkpA